MINFKQELANLLLKENLALEEDFILSSLETPPDKKMGDYAFPCFVLAKQLRKSPKLIAEELKDKISADFLEKIENVGGYLNFFIKAEYLAKTTIESVLEKKEKYGSTNQGEGKTICVEYSSTNIAKPFHIGHLRSTVQGDVIASIFEFLGYKTIRINYLGDYGTQFGMLINAYELWGNKEALDQDPIKEMLRLYVKYNEEAEKDEKLLDEARRRFYLLEQKSEREMEIWEKFKELSLREFKRVYDLLDISFDSWDGEAYHSQFMPAIIEELKEKNMLIEDEGAWIIPLDDEDMPPAIVIKSNGSSTYIARDIATANYRKKTYDFTESIYVVATEQNLHFRQLKEILSRMGRDWWDQVTHVSFGMVSLKDGAMGTRKGKVLFLEDVINQAIDKTMKIMEERNPLLENKKEVAKAVGIGAIKFQELYNNRIKDYVFSWDEILNFEGETGPYVQYTTARCGRVLEKAGEEGIDYSNNINFALISDESEKNLVRSIYDFPETIQDACRKKEPSLITRHIANLAKEYNKFYNSCPILNAPNEEVRKLRLAISFAAFTGLKIGLTLLGIQAPKEM